MKRLLMLPLFLAGLGAEEPKFTPLFAEEGVPKGWVVTQWDDLAKPAAETVKWRVRDGVLHGSEERGAWLISEREYADFVLQYEFKLGPQGNSGLAMRTPLAGDPAFDALELQMCDERYKPNSKPSELTGAIYRAVAPSAQRFLPGEWNTMRVSANGSRISAELNGVVVLDLDLEAYPNPVPAARHDGTDALALAKRPRKGRIGFQELSRGGTHVMIRNARIQEIATGSR